MNTENVEAPPLQLPPELWRLIFSYLSGPQVAHCARVCRAWNQAQRIDCGQLWATLFAAHWDSASTSDCLILTDAAADVRMAHSDGYRALFIRRHACASALRVGVRLPAHLSGKGPPYAIALDGLLELEKSYSTTWLLWELQLHYRLLTQQVCLVSHPPYSIPTQFSVPHSDHILGAMQDGRGETSSCCSPSVSHCVAEVNLKPLRGCDRQYGYAVLARYYR